MKFKKFLSCKKKELEALKNFDDVCDVSKLVSEKSLRKGRKHKLIRMLKNNSNKIKLLGEQCKKSDEKQQLEDLLNVEIFTETLSKNKELLQSWMHESSKTLSIKQLEETMKSFLNQKSISKKKLSQFKTFLYRNLNSINIELNKLIHTNAHKLPENLDINQARVAKFMEKKRSSSPSKTNSMRVECTRAINATKRFCPSTEQEEAVQDTIDTELSELSFTNTHQLPDRISEKKKAEEMAEQTTETIKYATAKITAAEKHLGVVSKEAVVKTKALKSSQDAASKAADNAARTEKEKRNIYSLIEQISEKILTIERMIVDEANKKLKLSLLLVEKAAEKKKAEEMAEQTTETIKYATAKITAAEKHLGVVSREVEIKTNALKSSQDTASKAADNATTTKKEKRNIYSLIEQISEKILTIERMIVDEAF